MLRIRAQRSAPLLMLSSALLALAGCGADVSTRPALAPGSAPTAVSGGLDAPSITAVHVERAGHDLAIRLVLASETGLPRPALTGANSGRAGWTFQLGFDTDRDPRTGDASGAELAAVVDERGQAALLAWSPAGWRRVASAPIDERHDEIGFRLDATRFAAPLASAAVTAESYAVQTDAAGGSEVAALGRLTHADEPTLVPAMTRLRSEVRGDTLLLRGQFMVSGHGDSYDPGHAGGWMLQLLLDTGQDGVGYWRGYDYIVRGGEWSGGHFTVRRITLDDSTPGGWGPATGVARFRLLPRHFELAIPLAALGGDDGGADFALETYLTVGCPACEGGVSQQVAADYFGATSGVTRRHDAVHLVAGSDAARLGIAAPPSLTASAR